MLRPETRIVEIETYSDEEIAPVGQETIFNRLSGTPFLKRLRKHIFIRLFLDANVLFTAAHNPSGKAALIVPLGVQGNWEIVSVLLCD